MQTDQAKEFGKWRAFFWPIRRSELAKFFPLLLVFFFITLNYNLLRTFKDSIIVTAPNSGAEAIPFIKVWGILPSALLLTFLFTRLANRFDREKVFYIMMLLFLVFFFVFTFILYPLQDVLHPHALADRIQAYLPMGLKGLVALFRNWTFTLFYIMSELWSTAIMSVLFWGFANEVTGVGEARRYYGLLMIGANISSIVAGQLSHTFSRIDYIPWIPYGTTKWEQSIFFMTCLILGCGILSLLVFRWLNRKIIGPSEKLQSASIKKEKIRMSLRKNFSYLANSKYLICIALIVVTYNIAINLIEVVWKNQIKAVYPDPSDFQGYMAQVTMAIGVISTFASLFISGNIIRCFSWTVSAMIPAVIMLVTGVAFFSFVVFQDYAFMTPLAATIGLTPTAFAIFLGGMQNVCARTCKFTFFDPTKEIAFIPLNNESKLKGKAAIDGVGSRIGKSGGSLIHQGLLFVFSSLSVSAPYVGAIFLIIILVWILSVISLGKQFNDLVSRSEKLSVPTGDKPAFDKPAPIQG